MTPDSFSDGGKWNNIDMALKRTEIMIDEGADIIDIGGESTRPGYEMISAEEEIGRIIPVIESIKKHFDIPLSVDTYKSPVAKAALEIGTDLINDIWGLKYDPEMAHVIAKYNAACCLMHNKKNAEYTDLLSNIKADLLDSADKALSAGIRKDKIILDPGIGFGKTYEMNLEVLQRLKEITDICYPVLLGCSRKSVIGNTLLLPADQRLEGTLVTTVQAVFCGCSFVRVHDVKENYRTVKMAKALL